MNYVLKNKKTSVNDLSKLQIKLTVPINVVQAKYDSYSVNLVSFI